MIENYDMEVIKTNLKILTRMEYLGIHIEDTKETDGIPGKILYYFSVPETSTIEVENKEVNEKIKTSDGLIAIAKEALIDMIMNACDDEELLEDIKNNLSDYVKFYAKVRNGEVWNEELGNAAVEKLIPKKEYKEV